MGQDHPSGEPGVEPLPPEGWDGMPEVDVFDLAAGEWRRLPHMSPGSTFELRDPERYVEPTTGTLQLRFVNERQDQVGFGFNVTIAGTVR
jgi:hypothetical protein